MADKKGLQLIGLILGAITVAVISIAAVSVVNASDGRLNDDQRPVLAINAAYNAR